MRTSETVYGCSQASWNPPGYVRKPGASTLTEDNFLKERQHSWEMLNTLPKPRNPK